MDERPTVASLLLRLQWVYKTCTAEVAPFFSSPQLSLNDWFNLEYVQ